MNYHMKVRTLQHVKRILLKMQSFSSFQKNMCLPISEGNHEDLSALRDLNTDIYAEDRCLDDFEYDLRDRMKGRIMGLKAELSRKATYEGCQTAPQPVSKSTPDQAVFASIGDSGHYTLILF